MRKNASVTIISLWVLVILAMLVVGIGHRVSMSLRLSRYQRDKLRTAGLAKAGINRAIVEILNNKNWADNEQVFKEISFSDDKNEFAEVSYTMKKEDGQKTTVFGVTDEERKINLNIASGALLTELLNSVGVVNAEELANNICAWRGRDQKTIPDYKDLGYANKGKDFSNIQELSLIQGITPEIYAALEGLITVYSSGKININTAPLKVLKIIGSLASKQAPPKQNFPSNFSDIVINLRNQGAIFKSLEEIKSPSGLTEEQFNILNTLSLMDVKSSCFLMASNGKINQSNFRHAITAIFNRDTKKIVYWYEN